MTCPVCNGSTKIVETRKNDDNVVRFRKCLHCQYRFSTIEVDEDFYERRTAKRFDDTLRRIRKTRIALKEIAERLSELEAKYD